MAKRKNVFAVPKHLQAGAKVEAPVGLSALDLAELRHLDESSALTDKLFAATVFAGEMKARADQAEHERDELRRQLKAEQDAARRVVTRLHEALGGGYTGSYLDEACERLRAVASGNET